MQSTDVNLRCISGTIFLVAIILTFFGAASAVIVALLIFSFLIFLLSEGFHIKRLNLFGKLVAELTRVERNIVELKKLVGYISLVTVELMQAQGKLGSKESDKFRDEQFNKLVNILHEFEFSEKEIHAVTSRWFEWVELDYVFAILGSGVPKGIEIDEWHKKARRLKTFGTTPDELRSLFEGFGLSSNELIASKIDAFEYYRAKHRHKDYDDWLDRKSWVESFWR